jgi:hypothetical protein
MRDCSQMAQTSLNIPIVSPCFPFSFSLFCHDAIDHFTVNVAIAIAVITAVIVATTDIKSITAATVASAAAIVATFPAAAFS